LKAKVAGGRGEKKIPSCPAAKKFTTKGGQRCLRRGKTCGTLPGEKRRHLQGGTGPVAKIGFPFPPTGKKGPREGPWAMGFPVLVRGGGWGESP